MCDNIQPKKWTKEEVQELYESPTSFTWHHVFYRFCKYGKNPTAWPNWVPLFGDYFVDLEPNSIAEFLERIEITENKNLRLKWMEFRYRFYTRQDRIGLRFLRWAFRSRLKRHLELYWAKPEV